MALRFFGAFPEMRYRMMTDNAFWLRCYLGLLVLVLFSLAVRSQVSITMRFRNAWLRRLTSDQDARAHAALNCTHGPGFICEQCQDAKAPLTVLKEKVGGGILVTFALVFSVLTFLGIIGWILSTGYILFGPEGFGISFGVAVVAIGVLFYLYKRFGRRRTFRNGRSVRS